MHFVRWAELLTCILLDSYAVVFCLSILVPRIVRLVPMPPVIHMSMEGFQGYVSVFLFSYV